MSDAPDAQALIGAVYEGGHFTTSGHEALDALQVRILRLETEREKWKALAEFRYGMTIYPQDVGLGRGALDVFFRREWDNGRYEAFLEQAEQAAARSIGGIK